MLIKRAEGGGGKIKLLKAGAYEDNAVDISLITHPGIDADAALLRTAAYTGFHVEYFGKVRPCIRETGMLFWSQLTAVQEAHAAARPWDGVRCSLCPLHQAKN